MPADELTTCSAPQADRRWHDLVFVWVQLSFPIDAETQARTGYCTRTVVDGLTETVEFGNRYAVWLENAATGVNV